MTLYADRLCLLASPRPGDVKGETARRLRDAGFTVWAWPPPHELNAAALPAFDVLVVLGAGSEWPASSTSALVTLLRQAWRQGATLGLFNGAVDLLGRADIVPNGAPIEAAGLFIGEQHPSAGTVEELTDALHSGPYMER
jgi:hypothetical protein